MSYARYRTDGPHYATADYSESISGGPPSTYSVNYVRSEKEMFDTVTPLYKRLMAQGNIINNAVTFNTESTDWSSGHAVYTKFNKERVVDGSIEAKWLPAFPFYADSSLETSGSVADAKQQCLANVDSTPTEMLEDLFELKSTMKLIGSPLAQMRELAFEFNRRAVVTAKYRKISFARAAAGVWLQMRFAFMPLLRSVNQLAGLLALDKIDRPSRRTARGSSSGSNDSTGQTSAHVPAIAEWTHKLENEFSAVIGYHVTNPAADTRFALGARWKDVPKFLWQIVPLSFMIDRLFNISDMISGLMNIVDPSISFNYASTSTRKTQKFTMKVVDVNYVSIGSLSSGGISRETFSLVRQVWEPSWTDAIPSVNISGLFSSVATTIDLITLIINLCTRPK